MHCLDKEKEGKKKGKKGRKDKRKKESIITTC